VIAKPADTAQPIATNIAERWSGRAYDPAVPVTQEQIVSLCEAARWAPSCFGDQPWRFVVWNRHENESAWQRAQSCLVPGNQEWANDASLLVLVCSVSNFTHNDKPNRWVGYDAGAAAISMCLQATELGLMSHQMGGYDAEKVRTEFNLPDDIQLWGMIAIGHPAALDSLSEEQLERELKARERRPLEEQFFMGAWNSPLKSEE
jgi:nitroreductase